MIANNLVLDVPPGIGLLGMAFEAEGYCVVNGPDLLWGRDMRGWHPVKGAFEGVIGGPPCPEFSPLRHLIKAHGYETKHGNLIPEFERIAKEASPDWVLMEEGPDAPDCQIEGYASFGFFLNPLWLGEEQSRKRKLCFSVRGARPIDLRAFIDYVLLQVMECERVLLYSPTSDSPQRIKQPAVTSHADPIPVALNLGGRPKIKSLAVTTHPEFYPHHLAKREAPVLTSGQPTYFQDGKVRKAPRRSFEECLRLQGLPPDFLKDSPFTLAAKREMIGNGVPLSMGRAVAKAIRRATSLKGK